MLRMERAEKNCCTPLVTFWGTLVANEVIKKLLNKFVGGQEGSFGAVAPVPLPCYVLRLKFREYGWILGRGSEPPLHHIRVFGSLQQPPG